MRSLVLAFSLVALSPSGALAQELEPCAPDITENRRAVREHNGSPGIWFHIEVARCMLTRLTETALYMRRISMLEERLQLSDERLELQQRVTSLAEQEAEQVSGALDAAIGRAREAEESRDAWYRHPALWAAVGVVLTVAVEAVAIWALNRVGT